MSWGGTAVSAQHAAIIAAGVGGTPGSGACYATFHSASAIGYCVVGHATAIVACGTAGSEIQWSIIPTSAEPGLLPHGPTSGVYSHQTCG